MRSTCRSAGSTPASEVRLPAPRANRLRSIGRHRRSGRGRRTRENPPSSETAAARTAALDDGTEELKDALDDLDGSTNRLRRRFRRANDYLETKVQVDRVVDDAKRINQVMTRGRYNAEVKRLWGILRVGINDLARAYNITPLGI